jgi:hypothetical protein
MNQLLPMPAPPCNAAGASALKPPLACAAGNHHSTSKACIHQEAFATVVTEHQGWQFINEGAAQNKSKWGYVSTEPGAKLKVGAAQQVEEPSCALAQDYVA